MNAQLEWELERFRSNRTAGASELVAHAIAILTQAQEGDRAEGQSPDVMVEVGRALIAAHPSMASIWNLVGFTLSSPTGLDRFIERTTRATHAVARMAASLFPPPRTPGKALRIVTCSVSSSVGACVEAIARDGPVAVACAEGRPLFEGRAMAGRVAATGVRVELYTDAAVHVALENADAVLVGADTVSARWFINKVGTRQLTETARSSGTSVCVVAARDKLADPLVAERVGLKEGAPSEVWREPLAGVHVRNPYFEKIPVDLAAGFVTDVGVLGPDDLSTACLASGPGWTPDLLRCLGF